MHWDPDTAPDPAAWLGLDEQSRTALVAAWHHAHPTPGLHPPGTPRTLHAAIHALLETQIARVDPPDTARCVARLEAAGLRRHAALHAVMRVLTEQIASVGSASPKDAAWVAARLDALQPEDAIPVQGLAWAEASQTPRNRAARRRRS